MASQGASLSYPVRYHTQDYAAPLTQLFLLLHTHLLSFCLPETFVQSDI